MRYGVLGTGYVACTIADKLIELGHEVMMGSRKADNPRAVEWARKGGEQAFHGTFADAAKFGERVFNCVKGVYSIEVLTSAGKDNLAGKILIGRGSTAAATANKGCKDTELLAQLPDDPS